MSKKRGLSLDEKRERLLQCFHNSASVFVLKEVEKMGAAKGIVLQSVKEVLQSLVDDDLVHQEKIGASNYFWSFPSEATVRLENDLKALEDRISAAKKQQSTLDGQIAEERKGKDDSENRTAKVGEMRALEEKRGKLECELNQYKENDPEAVQALKEATGVAKDAANRWLDNLYALQGWCKKQFQGREDEVDGFFKQCGMGEDIDYLE